VPFRAVKNIKLGTIDLSERTLQIIKGLSNEGISVYTDIIKRIFFSYDNPKGAPVDWDLTGKIRENLSEAIVEDNFSFLRVIFSQEREVKSAFRETQNRIWKN